MARWCREVGNTAISPLRPILSVCESGPIDPAVMLLTLNPSFKNGLVHLSTLVAEEQSRNQGEASIGVGDV
jgi:hypothetical protein